MTLDEFIMLVESIEQGKEGQVIGFHLHEPLRELTTHRYGRSSKTFSEVLKDIKREEL